MTLKILHAALMMLAMVAALRLMQSGLERLAPPRGRFLLLPLVPVLRLGVILGTLWLVANLFAPGPEAVLAALASGGVALGLGAQDLVRNLIGGLVILGDRPFQVGDRVRIGEVAGEIEHIGLRSTRVVTFEDTRITLPNSVVVSSAVQNGNSGVPESLVVTDLYLPAGVDPDLAIRIGTEAAYSCPYILHSRPVVALLSDHFDRAPYTRLRIKGYVYDHRQEPRLQSDVTARAKAELKRRGLLEWNHVR